MLAVEYCHDIAGIIHRDIKPDNILIDGQDNIKLADFGVSMKLAADGEDDKITSNAGALICYSPEAFLGTQFRGKLTDIWCCGITLFFMAMKRYPFASGDRIKLKRMVTYD